VRIEVMAIIFGMAAVTFFTRFAAPALLRRTGIPEWLERWLEHVPTAILTALIVPALLLPRGYLDLSPQNHYLLAGIIAAVAAYKSRSILLTLAVGMAAMLVLRRVGL